MFGHTFLLISAALGLTACQDYKVINVKEYKIYADTQDSSLQHAVEVLAQRYNTEIGSTVLIIVDSPEAANSRIRFVSGLHKDGSKLGLGQWITTRSEKVSYSLEGQDTEATVDNAMDIEFDAENFSAKAPGVDQPSSDQALHLYHLFCHEVGHGMHMNHSKELESVMYESIPGRPNRFVNFNAYFNQARKFMGASKTSS